MQAEADLIQAQLSGYVQIIWPSSLLNFKAACKFCDDTFARLLPCRRTSVKMPRKTLIPATGKMWTPAMEDTFVNKGFSTEQSQLLGDMASVAMEKV